MRQLFFLFCGLFAGCWLIIFGCLLSIRPLVVLFTWPPVPGLHQGLLMFMPFGFGWLCTRMLLRKN
jgi:hypothetical protein